MVYVNDYLCGSDSESIERAMAARDKDGIVVFAPRESESDPGRNYWLIDRAILLPEKTTVILRNCDIKLSDRCRDNFFRTANCGFGFPDPKPISGVHIKGEGLCRLIGADHPRASGDSSKTLHAVCPFTPEDLCRYADWIPEERRSPEKLDFWDQHDHSYGTDALDPNDLSIMYALANTYDGMEEYAKAYDYCERCIAKYPNGADHDEDVFGAMPHAAGLASRLEKYVKGDN